MIYVDSIEGVFQQQSESIVANTFGIQATEGEVQHETNPWTQIQFGTLFSAQQTADDSIVLTFSSSIDLNTPFLDPASYSIQEAGGYPVSITSVQLLGASSIKLVVSLGTDGESYTVNIDGALKLLSGTNLQGTTADYTANVSRPSVTDAISTGANTILVTFDRDMKIDGELLDPSNYTFDNDLEAKEITVVAPNQVEVRTSAQTSDLVYEVTVSP